VKHNIHLSDLMSQYSGNTPDSYSKVPRYKKRSELGYSTYGSVVFLSMYETTSNYITAIFILLLPKSLLIHIPAW